MFGGEEDYIQREERRRKYENKIRDQERKERERMRELRRKAGLSLDPKVAIGDEKEGYIGALAGFFAVAFLLSSIYFYDTAQYGYYLIMQLHPFFIWSIAIVGALIPLSGVFYYAYKDEFDYISSSFDEYFGFFVLVDVVKAVVTNILLTLLFTFYSLPLYVGTLILIGYIANDYTVIENFEMFMRRNALS